MKKLMIILLIIIGSGCSTYKFDQEPDDSNNTLTVGRVKLVIQKTDVPEFPKGEYFSGMVVIFLNINTNEETTITAKDKGYFYTNKLEPGIYRIRRITYKGLNGGTSWINTSENEIVYISDNVVNNLGLLTWVADLGYGKRKSIFHMDHYKIKEFIEKENEGSHWFEKTWINVKRFESQSSNINEKSL